MKKESGNLVGVRGAIATAVWRDHHLQRTWLLLAGCLAAAVVIPSCRSRAIGGEQNQSPTTAGQLVGTPAQGLPSPTLTEALPSPTVSLQPTSTPTATQVLNPLTGLPVSDPSILARRVVAIKVSNYPRTARPQAGLSFADLLFEFYQEGGETRFQALFLSRDVDTVGPIRSGRIVDSLLERMYQSILVFNAEDPRVWNRMSILGTSKVYEGAVPPPALRRDTSQADINSVYGNTAALREEAAAVGIPPLTPDLGGMLFDQTPLANGRPATDLLVRFLTDYARAEWRYDPASAKYYRWSETDSGGMAPLTDRLTGRQLSVSNLVVAFVYYVRHKEGPPAEMYDVNLMGSGEALLFRDGQEWEGSWRVVNPNRPLQFFGENGPFALHPGVTWMALVGGSSTFTNSGDGWRVEFALP